MVKQALIAVLLILPLFVFLYDLPADINNDDIEMPIVNDVEDFGSLYSPAGDRAIEGPEREIVFFKDWYYPHSHLLEPSFWEEIWREVEAMPDESEFETVVNEWECIGPYGMWHIDTIDTRYTGRVREIEIENTVSVRVAAASGGLWGYNLGALPNPLTEDLNTQNFGSFASKPGDPSTIIIGTGEPYLKAGTGIFKTTDSGASWTSIPHLPGSYGFYKLRYKPVPDGDTLFAASTSGFYLSSDNGDTWERKFVGNISDFDICSDNPDIIYAGKYGDSLTGGLYRSFDGGDSFSKVNGVELPQTNVGRIAVSVYSPYTIYTSIVYRHNQKTMGVYRTNDGGANWTYISPADNFHGEQGWYDNVISVCPVDSNILLVGGVTLFRSSNGGNSWEQVITKSIHVDHHVLRWSSDGNQLWSGNDGGIMYSSDRGITWDSYINYLPITQYNGVDICQTNPAIMYGGSQDNGFSHTTDFGTSWTFSKGGDGVTMVVDPISGATAYGTLGYYGGNWTFCRMRSTDFGQNWYKKNNGVAPSSEAWNKIESDKVAPIYLYANSGPNMFVSVDQGDNWTQLNPDPFPAWRVFDFAVSHFVNGQAVVYASIDTKDPDPTGKRLRVYDDNTWFERSDSLPVNLLVRKIATKPYNNEIAYAVMTGFSNGEKVYRTTDRGIHWENISGNLPNVAAGDLVAHPSDDNLLFLGTNAGCYRTLDGGVSWHRWNKGMPEANIVTDMVYIDSTGINGKFYIVAASYGRSVWVREGSGDDTVVTVKDRTLPEEFTLRQNYPNPFNAGTVISYVLPVDAFVDLTIYDAAGREVTTIISAKQPAGEYNIPFNAKHLASGVYYYQLTANKFSEVKKMVILK